jgi:hypothetical protein
MAANSSVPDPGEQRKPARPSRESDRRDADREAPGREARERDPVDEAEEESFPASDPPAHTPAQGARVPPRRERP